MPKDLPDICLNTWDIARINALKVLQSNSQSSSAGERSTYRLLALNNPNSEILDLPTEKGGSEEDNYLGSIGDATLKHVQSLSKGEEILWRELVKTSSGAIFRFAPDLTVQEKDPYNLKGKKDLENYLEKLKHPRDYVDRQTGEVIEVRALTEDELIPITEAIENELERREESQDVLDVAELIPFDEWEKFPQMWKHIDIPSTPKDRPIYVGNTRQSFYDSFPEGHSDSKAINQYLSILNRSWDQDIDEGYADFIQKWIDQQHLKDYTRSILTSLTKNVLESYDNLNELVSNAMLHIDLCWSIEYRNGSAKKSLGSDMLKLFLRKEEQWKSLHKQGYNIYASVKSFGQILFQNFRDEMSGYLWARYRRNKITYSPKVVLRGVDINRCGLSDLRNTLNLEDALARKLWHARPFETLDEAFNKGYLTSSSLLDGTKVDKVIGFIDKHSNICKTGEGLPYFNKVRQILIRQQKKDSSGLSSDQWNTIWRYYRIVKYDLQEYFNGQKEEEKR